MRSGRVSHHAEHSAALASHYGKPMTEVGLEMDPQDLDRALRLAVAVVVGMAVGLNRDLKGKPTGIRTLGLVCLGSALVGVVSLRMDGILGHPDATSRVVQGIIQGVMTGIGFLGAGVVLVNRSQMRIQGLTTAAAVWVTAALGIACALASWPLILAGVSLTLFLLVIVHPVERWLEAKAQAGNTPATPEVPNGSRSATPGYDPSASARTR